MSLNNSKHAYSSCRCGCVCVYVFTTVHVCFLHCAIRVVDSQLIACVRASRVCVSTELVPHHCDCVRPQQENLRLEAEKRCETERVREQEALVSRCVRA